MIQARARTFLETLCVSGWLTATARWTPCMSRAWNKPIQAFYRSLDKISVTFCLAADKDVFGLTYVDTSESCLTSTL